LLSYGDIFLRLQVRIHYFVFMSNSEDKIKSIISTGSEMLGAATGGVLGFFLGGPAGAAAGVAISKGVVA
jgi:hypothetical protein